MKETLLLLIAFLSISFGAFSQTNWTNVGNGLQQRLVNGKLEYRFLKSSGYGAPFGVSDSLLNKLNLADSLIKYVTPKQLNTAISGVTIPDATAAIKGKIKLAGDLAGTADLPTIPALINKANTNGSNASGSWGINITGNAANSTKWSSLSYTGISAPVTDYLMAYQGDNTFGVANAEQIRTYLDIFSGNYNDLSNKPAIPTNTNQLVNGAGFLVIGDIAGKVDKVAGKGLSTEDFTSIEKTKLSGIATGATANSSDATLLNRANHTGTQPISTVTGLQTALDSKIPLDQKGMNNGVAPLDAAGKVPVEYLPSGAQVYKGTWDASVNNPTLADGSGTAGWTYRVSVGGTRNLGSGNITFIAGDDVIYNGSVWQRNPSAILVNSVNGQTGTVMIGKADLGLSNVDNTSDIDKPISATAQVALNDKANANGSNASGNWAINIAGSSANSAKWSSLSYTGISAPVTDYLMAYQGDNTFGVANAEQIRTYLSMPATGETLASVTARGQSTPYYIATSNLFRTSGGGKDWDLKGDSDNFYIQESGLNPALTIAKTTGNATILGGLSSGGKLSWGSGTYEGTSGIYNSVADGTLLIPKAGTSTDLVLTNSGGQTVMQVPTGTNNALFNGGVNVTGTLNVSNEILSNGSAGTLRMLGGSSPGANALFSFGPGGVNYQSLFLYGTDVAIYNPSTGLYGNLSAGAATFTGQVTSPQFNGSLNGNAVSATSASNSTTWANQSYSNSNYGDAFTEVMTYSGDQWGFTSKADFKGSLGLPTSYFSGNYNDLSNKPTVPTNTNQLTNGSGYITTSALSPYQLTSGLGSAAFSSASAFKTSGYVPSWSEITGKPTLFSGNYNDLSNKPVIPTNNNQLSNGAGYITSSALSGYAPLSSPFLTGSPLTTTPPIDDNSLRIANTGFVKNAIASAIGSIDGTASGAYLPTMGAYANVNTIVPNYSTYTVVGRVVTVYGRFTANVGETTSGSEVRIQLPSVTGSAPISELFGHGSGKNPSSSSTPSSIIDITINKGTTNTEAVMTFLPTQSSVPIIINYSFQYIIDIV